MSILLLDLGNTALKWALLDNCEETNAYVHNSSGVLGDGVIEQWESLNIEAAYGTTVASEWISHGINQALHRKSVDCHWLQSTSEFNGDFRLRNGYAYPHMLGADRWHAAIGAVTLHPNEALLIIHMGTAATVDSVIPQGDNEYLFLGGRIAPGPAMMLEGLSRGTAHLPRALGKYQDFPDNTVDAITTGIIDSQLGLVQRAYSQMKAICESPRILLAGGAARLIAPHLSKEFEKVDLRHNLVITGLATRAKTLTK